MLIQSVNKYRQMAATKETHQPNKGRHEVASGKQHAIQIIVDGVEYKPTDMVPRGIAIKISNIHPTNFSTKISKGEIEPYGYGKKVRFKVSDCVEIAMKKPVRNYPQSNKAA